VNMSKPDGIYWDKRSEVMSRDELEALQVRRLKETIGQATKSEFYSKLFQEHGINPDSINDISDIRKLPFTTKDDLRKEFPYGMLCVPKEETVRLHTSSGTTGQATVIFHTRKDLDQWAELIARCMYMVGVRKEDVFQNMTGYGLFTGGLGFHYGAEKLGALTIPAGAGNSKRQIQLMQQFGTTVLHIIPSYALRLMNILSDQGIDPRKDLDLRIAFLGAEPYTEEIRQRVENYYGIDAFNSYGLSEMNGPGVAFECPEKKGLHIWEDCYVVEIVNPDTLEPVEIGEVGELVMTTLTREAMPLIRYRTKDLTRFLPGECSCGRVHRRIDWIQGRSDDMIIIKGVNIFPMQVEQVLMGMPEVGNNYVIILEKENEIDQIRVQVEVHESIFQEDMRYLNRLREKIVRELKSEILVTPRVDLVESRSLPQSDGKAVRLIDRR